MSYITELAAISRKPCILVIINLDYCDNTFGSAPCTATGTKCYNTHSTCKDTANYVSTAGKDYKFCLNDSKIPFQGEIIRPYLIKEPSYLPTELDQTRSITINARVTIEFYDEPDNDIGIDPYVTTRSTYPNAVGTFWGKLIARNPYYIGRAITIKKGFLGLTEAEFISWQFIIDQIDINDGKVKLVCKDPLKLADRVEVPKATDGKITDNPLLSASTSIGCDDTTDYDASGYIRIDDEIIGYTGKVSTAFTGCTRGQFDTIGSTHSHDAKIQLCYVQSSANVVDIIDDILQTHVGIATTSIDSTGFTAEKNQWLPAFIFTGIVSKPEKASKLLTELQEQSMSNLWWSEEDQKVKFKVLAPPAPNLNTITEINDDEHIADINVNYNEESRISRTVIYFNLDTTGDLTKPEHYANAHISIDINSESSNEYNENAIKTIYSRWIKTSAIPSVLASRFLRRFRNPAKKVSIILELKDSGIKTADVIAMTADQIVGIDGAAVSKQRYQVTKKQQKSPGKFNYELLDTAWIKNYGFIAPAGQADWDSASTTEKLYAYICDSNEKLGAADDNGFYIF